MTNEIFNDEVYIEITDILLHCQIKPNVSGFDYLRTAIRMCIEDADLKTGITKRLYPEVGKLFGTSGVTVERGIRTAIESAYNRGGLLEVNELCGAVIYNNDYKLSNSEMITTIVEVLAMRKNKEALKDRAV